MSYSRLIDESSATGSTMNSEQCALDPTKVRAVVTEKVKDDGPRNEIAGLVALTGETSSCLRKRTDSATHSNSGQDFAKWQHTCQSSDLCRSRGCELEIRVLELEEITTLASREEAWVQLLLLRDKITDQLGRESLRPDLVLSRGLVYEALCYDELAVGDAYTAFTLANEDSEDLIALIGDSEGAEWSVDGEDGQKVRRDALQLLIRGLRSLGATYEVGSWEKLLKQAGHDPSQVGASWKLFDRGRNTSGKEGLEGISGKCQRTLYPWNEHEPDRMSDECLAEIGATLKSASNNMLVCKKTILPSLSTETKHLNGSIAKDSPPPSTGKTNAQLGLFAATNIAADTIILRERTTLSAIRPHDAALCDCCTADLESIDPSSHRSCPACSLPFCSETCLAYATSTYHRPNIEDSTTDSGYAPSHAPFCPGITAETPFTELGHAESSSTPEWDLYFLLLVRCIQTSITLSIHPLDLFETKYLWGSFAPSPTLSNTSISTILPQPTLPFSFNHHITLPFQLFELLLPSLPQFHPYSPAWLRNFDFWILNTLYAKFRGVATAKQSSFDGKPETAQVHPLWCLANHNCEPNVGWESGGERVLRSREKGLGRGEEVWSCYTDVTEKDVRVRRGRLREVLGGDCLCVRCMREAKELDDKS